MPLKNILWSAAIILSLAPLIEAEEQEIDFRRDVQPIFKSRCYECHGEDAREGGVRLSNRRDAFLQGDSEQRIISPGNPAQSYLLERVQTDDEDLKMPPDGEPLTAAQIDLIRQWIQAGADWPEGEEQAHWAYQAPRRPPLPQINSRFGPKHPIDYFIINRLAERDLAPSPPADPARLFRRLSFDLIGLPPTIEQVDRFLKDPSHTAYEKAVDQLLASEHFGEKWARHWLDLARYADSNGYQADQLRESWAYRDWVIDALNQDLPFDQFTIEQLAGDLLPNSTVDQKIATGFHRTVTCNVEAGVHPEENRVNQVVDRVNTTGTVWLGTSLECAQCHNHKYDPFTQQEYYRIFSFFNNTPLEVKQTAGVTYDFVGPKMSLPLPSDVRDRYEALAQEQTKWKTKVQKIRQESKSRQQKWEERLLAQLEHPPRWIPLEVTQVETTGGEDHEILADQSVLISGSLPGTTTYTARLTSPLSEIHSIKLEALTHPSLPGKGPGRADAVRTNFVMNDFSLYQITEQREQKIELVQARADFSQANWDVSGLIDDDPKSGWAIAPQFHKDHWASMRLATPISSEQPIHLKVVMDQLWGRGRVLGRFRLLVLEGDPEVANLPPEVLAILKKTNRKKADQKKLDDHYESFNDELTQAADRLKRLERQLNSLAPPSTLVMVEMSQPRETRVMKRGNYLNLGGHVEPGVPEILHDWNPQWPANRLGFAQWLVSRDNPLVARVTVNRLWAELMGQGIVKSIEDLGTQSEPPTHPELLDWLAVEFMDSSWSLKQVIKQIVMSETYRQSARTTSEHLEKDPENRFYARGPRLRMSAEMIRDNALIISGLFSSKMGGPPIMPYQPGGIWRSVGRNAPKWKEDQGENRYRRGIYVIWRRAAPYPSFVNFDAPDRSSCVVNRSRTNTPLQALTLLNDPAYTELALAFADQILQECPQESVSEKLSYAMKKSLAREPHSAEVTLLQNLYQEQAAHYRSRPELARALVSSIPGYKPATSDRVELAAWFAIANTILNLDETITK